MTDKAPVTVDQGDRLAAEKFDRDLSARLTGTQLHNLAGVLASHRLQSIAALEEEIKRLREALERIGWHELTAREARDIARTALEGRGS